MSHDHKFKRYDLPGGGYTEQCVVCGKYLPTVVDALAAELKIQDEANDILTRRVAALESSVEAIANHIYAAIKEFPAAPTRTTVETPVDVSNGYELTQPSTALKETWSQETGAQPGIGPITPEPQDYKVQCRCGWMGTVSALKSLPEFKMGCPDCSTEFVPIDRMTFPVKIEVKHGDV